MRYRHLALGLASAVMIASGIHATSAVATPANLPALPPLPPLPADPQPPQAPPAPFTPEQLEQLQPSPNRAFTGYGRDAAPVDVNVLRDPTLRDRVDPVEKVEPGNMVAFGDSIFANPTPGDITNGTVASAVAKKEPKAYAMARAAGVNVSLHGCPQGQKRLPRSIAEALKVPLNDYSCPGATVYSKSIKPPLGTQVEYAIQDGALNESTKYVIMQGGFNDIYQNYLRPDGELPNSDKLARLTGQVTQKDAYASNLDAMLRKIQEHAPHARISLVGYHTITDGSKSGWQCLYHIGHGQGKDNVWDATARFPVYWDTEGERNINKWLREGADRNHVNFIDLRSKTQGHGECAAPKDRWVAGIFIDQTTAPYNLALHLTDEGIDNLTPMVTSEL